MGSLNQGASALHALEDCECKISLPHYVYESYQQAELVQDIQ